MKNYTTYLIALSLTLFFSCGNEKKNEATEATAAGEPTATEHQWTDKNKFEFERNCVAFLESEGVEKAKNYCDCLLETSLEAFPDPEVASELTQDEIVALFEKSECLDDLLLIKLEDPWTEEVEQMFLTHCQIAQKEKGVADEKAAAHCSCALDEIKEIIPNPHHVMTLTEEELAQILAKCE